MLTKHARISVFISLGLLPSAVGCDVAPEEETTEVIDDSETVEAVEAVAQPILVTSNSVGSGEPGGAIFKATKYATYTDGSGRVNVMKDNGTSSWNRQLLTEKAPAGSSLFVWNEFMYLVWVGTDGSINTMRTSDGTNWIDKRTFSWGVSGLPGLGFLGDRMHVVVRYGKIPEFWSSQDGVNWDFNGDLGDVRSNSSFSITNYGGLVLAWRDESSGRAAVRTYRSNTGWSAITLTDAFGNPSLHTVSAQRIGTSVLASQIAMAVTPRGFGGAATFVEIWRSVDAVNFVRETGSVPHTSPRKPVIVSSRYKSTRTATDMMTNDVVMIDSSNKLRWEQF